MAGLRGIHDRREQERERELSELLHGRPLNAEQVRRAQLLGWLLGRSGEVQSAIERMTAPATTAPPDGS